MVVFWLFNPFTANFHQLEVAGHDSETQKSGGGNINSTIIAREELIRIKCTVCHDHRVATLFFTRSHRITIYAKY